MANNLTLEDINNLYFWATKLEESNYLWRNRK